MMTQTINQQKIQFNSIVFNQAAKEMEKNYGIYLIRSSPWIIPSRMPFTEHRGNETENTSSINTRVWFVIRE